MDNSKGLIGLLVLIAIVLAVVIFAGMGGGSWFSSMTTSERPDTGNAPSGTTAKPSPATTTPEGSATTVALTGLSATEKKILTPPAQSASPAEQQAYADFVSKNAPATTNLSVGAGCKLSPVAITIKLGSTVTVKNTDTKAHTLGFDQTHTLVVAAGGSKQIATTFFKEAGIHGYGCDNVAGAAGMMVVTK